MVRQLLHLLLLWAPTRAFQLLQQQPSIGDRVAAPWSSSSSSPAAQKKRPRSSLLWAAGNNKDDDGNVNDNYASKNDAEILDGTKLNGFAAAATAAVIESETVNDDPNDATNDSVFLEIREKLKADLEALAFLTERGFKATNRQKKRARQLIDQLAECNPTAEPAASYYDDNQTNDSNNNDTNQPTLQGDWSLIYTDAPDILALDSSSETKSDEDDDDSDNKTNFNIFAPPSLPMPNLATLGRIGQQCQPPYVKNVIEWQRPAWADVLPWAGTEQSRILQKVVTRAVASPGRPRRVQLTLLGLEIETDGNSNNDDDPTKGLWDNLQQRGLVATLVDRAPDAMKQWQGPLSAPFGEFEILYLDQDIRITKTEQNYVAVNRRMSSETTWFPK